MSALSENKQRQGGRESQCVPVEQTHRAHMAGGTEGWIFRACWLVSLSFSAIWMLPHKARCTDHIPNAFGWCGGGSREVVGQGWEAGGQKEKKNKENDPQPLCQAGVAPE